MDNLLDKVLILKPYIEKVTSGEMFRFLFAWFYRILSGLILIGIFWASWELWSSMSSKMPAKFFIGGVILQIFIFVLAFVIINILLIRSTDILELPSTKEYSVTPIIIILLKTWGEILAASYLVLGFAMGIAIFIVGGNVGKLMPISLPGLSGAGSGFGVMVFGVIGSFLTLFFFYWLAEIWAAVVDTARNTSVMVQLLKKK